MNVIDAYINPQFMSVPKPVENETDPLIMNEVHEEIIEEQNPSVTKTKTSCSQKFKEMLNQAKNQMQSLCNSRVARIAAGSLCVALTAALAIICLKTDSDPIALSEKRIGSPGNDLPSVSDITISNTTQSVSSEHLESTLNSKALTSLNYETQINVLEGQNYAVLTDSDPQEWRTVSKILTYCQGKHTLFTKSTFLSYRGPVEQANEALEVLQNFAEAKTSELENRVTQGLSAPFAIFFSRSFQSLMSMTTECASPVTDKQIYDLLGHT